MKVAVNLCACCGAKMLATGQKTLPLPIPLAYDHLFVDSDLDAFFQDLAQSSLRCLQGSNLSLFHIGPRGESQLLPLASRLMSLLLSHPRAAGFAFFCSFFSVGSEIQDLIQDFDQTRSYCIREDPDGSILVENLSEYRIHTSAELDFLIETGRRPLEGSTVLQVSIEHSPDKRSKINFCQVDEQGQTALCQAFLGLASAAGFVKTAPLVHVLKDSLNTHSRMILIPFLCPKRKEASEEAAKIAQAFRGIPFRPGRSDIQKRSRTPELNQWAQRGEIRIADVIEKINKNKQLKEKLKGIKDEEAKAAEGAHWRRAASRDEVVPRRANKRSASARRQSHIPRKMKERILLYQESKVKRAIDQIRKSQARRKNQERRERKREEMRKAHLEKQKKMLEEYRARRAEVEPSVQARRNSVQSKPRRMLVENFEVKSGIIGEIVKESFRELGKFVRKEELDQCFTEDGMV